MSSKHVVLAAIVFALRSQGQAQEAPGHPASVPIYKVTVIGRTVMAVNYQYRSGPTQIDFKGTVLLPQAKGDAVVESKAGRTEIEARFDRLTPSQQFGNEYLTYVLWAITPEGNVKNLGEVLANGSDKGHTHVTTDLQVFGLIVTAEPYSAVRSPSDVVVLENQARPDTIGGTVPIQVRYELMPRGTYTYNVPTGLRPEGRKVSMTEYEETLELYQAQNAVQIAEAQGAGQYAPDVFGKAQQQYESARRMLAAHGDKTAIITAARDATQTAEDARTLTTARKHEAELASARNDVDREQRLRLQAQADAQRAQAEAADAQAQAAAGANALEAERNARREAETRAAAPSAPPAPPVAEKTVAVQNQPDSARVALRARLLSQLGGHLQALDTPRGVVVTVRDFDFHGAVLESAATGDLSRVASLVMSQPGLQVEVDGNSDAPAGDRLALDRANAVKDALVRDGLRGDLVTARSLGDSHPFGPNSSAKGREDNRRVEIVIHGDAIGNSATWDKSYSLGR